MFVETFLTTINRCGTYIHIIVVRMVKNV